MNHCSKDSGVVCQIVVDAWPVQESQDCLMKTVRVCTMYKVYEVTRTVIKDNNRHIYQTEISRTIILEFSETQNYSESNFIMIPHYFGCKHNGVCEDMWICAVV